MLSLLNYLIQIRFRKFVAKGDYLAMLLICVFYVGIAVISYLYYSRITGFFYVVFVDVILYHFRRTDVELLKVYKHNKALIWIEYVFYSFPFLMVLVLKKEYVSTVIVLALYYLLLFVPKGKTMVIKYPFSLITPFWRINFRRYKLIWMLPLALLFCVMGYYHHNENLVIGSFVIISMIACLPTFERERIVEIKTAVGGAKDYLELQLKKEIYNTGILLLPLFLITCVLGFDLNYFFWASIIFVLPIINTVLKYVFFESKLKQQLFILGCMIGFGLLLLTVPLLYKKAINQLKQIKDVDC